MTPGGRKPEVRSCEASPWVPAGGEVMLSQAEPSWKEARVNSPALESLRSAAGLEFIK